MNDDPYLNKHGVLINKLNINDRDELLKAEREIASINTIKLLKENTINTTFDYDHLKNIHKAIFSDIYDWAGQERTVNIAKGDSMFALSQHVKPEANKLFSKLKNENYLKGLDQENVTDRLAYYLGEINVLHPFREGNGRTQRIFITQLAKNAGYELNFDSNKITQQDMIKASIHAMNVDHTQLKTIIKDNIKPIENKHLIKFKNKVEKVKQSSQSKKISW